MADDHGRIAPDGPERARPGSPHASRTHRSETRRSHRDSCRTRMLDSGGIMSFNYLSEKSLRSIPVAVRDPAASGGRRTRIAQLRGSAWTDLCPTVVISRVDHMNRKSSSRNQPAPGPKEPAGSCEGGGVEAASPAWPACGGEIDRLDQELVELLNRRAEIVGRRSARSSTTRGWRSGRRRGRTRSSRRPWRPAGARCRRRPCGSSSAS